MSYCRFVGPEGKRRLDALFDEVQPEGAPHDIPLSDVYVFAAVGNVLECCGCIMEGGSAHGSLRTRSRGEMVRHLTAHRQQGHHVPQAAIDAIEAEARERGDLLPEPCAACGGGGRVAGSRRGHPHPFALCEACDGTGDAP